MLSHFGRVVRLLISPIKGVPPVVLNGNLRVVFDVKKGTGSDANTCELEIYNLSKITISSAIKVGGIVYFEAGYSEAFGLEKIFTGSITSVVTTKAGTETVTKISVADGIVEMVSRRLSISLKSGSVLSDAVSLFVGSIGLPVRSNGFVVPPIPFSTGYSFIGNAHNGLSQLCESKGISYSIQDGEVVFLNEKTPSVGGTVMLNKTSGLVGVPEPYSDSGSNELVQNIAGYNVVSKLLPSVVPNDAVILESSSVKGSLFRAIEVSHTGDTHGEKFDTTLKLEIV